MSFDVIVPATTAPVPTLSVLATASPPAVLILPFNKLVESVVDSNS